MNTDFLNALRQVQQNNSGSTNYGSQATPNVELYGGGEKIGQDALDANGNVKLGQTFKLRKRK